MFSQQHWKTPENALITFIFINWGITIHFTTNWSLGAPDIIFLKIRLSASAFFIASVHMQQTNLIRFQSHESGIVWFRFAFHVNLALNKAEGSAETCLQHWKSLFYIQKLLCPLLSLPIFDELFFFLIYTTLRWLTDVFRRKRSRFLILWNKTDRMSLLKC